MKTKHAGGRPSKFDLAFIPKAKKYLERDYKKDEVVPTVEGLALYLGILRENVYDYAKKNAEFRHTLEDCQQTQAKRLIAMGLMNKFNSSITKLLLSVHGYRDESHIEHGADESLKGEIEKFYKAIGNIIK